MVDYTFVCYHYTPSIGAAIVFIILFLLGTFAHLYYVFKLKAKYFIPFVIGCIFECFGYVGRAWSHSEPTKLSPFIMQSILILVAPALFAASIYMVLGRIIRLLHADNISIIKPKWLTKIFVAGDVFSFLVQAAGAGLMAQGTLSGYNTGSNIVIVGLVIQMVIFGFFITCDPALQWQKHLHALYFTSVIILIRNVIRVIEYAQGNSGFIVSHEYMLYIFDAFFIFLVVLTFFVVHPSKLLGYKRSFEQIMPHDNDGFMLDVGADRKIFSIIHHRAKE
ncbi:RTA1 like protein-domain-containing protein [Delphinella strobiligena]|nr:RTA1 like protein-domain-containing protein [Delphinella strobiligena]